MFIRYILLPTQHFLLNSSIFLLSLRKSDACRKDITSYITLLTVKSTASLAMWLRHPFLWAKHMYPLNTIMLSKKNKFQKFFQQAHCFWIYKLEKRTFLNSIFWISTSWVGLKANSSYSHYYYSCPFPVNPDRQLSRQMYYLGTYDNKAGSYFCPPLFLLPMLQTSPNPCG